jgi:hypothetical protein
MTRREGADAHRKVAIENLQGTSGDTSKAAIQGHLKTGHMSAVEARSFYTV